MNELELVIPPRPLTLMEIQGFRILPYAKKRMVGPFIFLDHITDRHYEPETGMAVRAHPHIGLSTLSYLYKGHVLHRDSLGNELVLHPGDVNWMTAGKGIAHSERIPPDVRAHGFDFHMLQFWVALPLEKEDMEPEFFHHPQESIPEIHLSGCKIRLVAGEAFGQKSPVQVYSKLFFMDVQVAQQGRLEFSPEEQETCLYVLKGAVNVSGRNYTKNSCIVFQPRQQLVIESSSDSHYVLFGGKSFPESRHIYWNFVASTMEKIEAAKASWADGTFPAVVHETERIPLPAE